MERMRSKKKYEKNEKQVLRSGTDDEDQNFLLACYLFTLDLLLDLFPLERRVSV